MLLPNRLCCEWEYQLSSGLRPRRLQVSVRSGDGVGVGAGSGDGTTLDVNVTDSLLQLGQLVRRSWSEDYYGSPSPKGSPAGARRRAPFVPYALCNLSGHKLRFLALVSDADESAALRPLTVDDSWAAVRPGDTEPFSFGALPRDPRHRARLHQVALRVDGWTAVGPVCVDRVGCYYREAQHEGRAGVRVRVVLDVTLEGSARKLVTVRSALRLRNRLAHPVEVRVDLAPKPGQKLLLTT